MNYTVFFIPIAIILSSVCLHHLYQVRKIKLFYREEWAKEISQITEE